MSRSIVLQTSTLVVQPLLVFASAFFLAFGHDEPGGGFVGGLTAASAFALHAIAFGVASARRSLRLDPRSIAGLGLALAVAVAVVPVLAGDAPLRAGWTELAVGGGEALALGTPLLFDLGVYLVVLGSTLAAIFTLAEAEGST